MKTITVSEIAIKYGLEVSELISKRLNKLNIRGLVYEFVNSEDSESHTYLIFKKNDGDVFVYNVNSKACSSLPSHMFIWEEEETVSKEVNKLASEKASSFRLGEESLKILAEKSKKNGMTQTQYLKKLIRDVDLKVDFKQQN